MELIKAAGSTGHCINHELVISLAQAVVKGTDYQNLVFTEAWSKSLLRRLGYVTRRATTDRNLSETVLQQSALEMKMIHDSFDQYHPDLILEMDETLAPWVYSNKYTYAKSGSSTVRLVGHKDKRGSTVTLTITKSNQYLPPQTIWTGLSKNSIPRNHQPSYFLNCYAGQTGTRTTQRGITKKSNQWQNIKTMKDYTRRIIVPYVKRVRSDHDLTLVSKGTRGLLIMDHHYSHLHEEVKALLEEINLHGCEIYS